MSMCSFQLIHSQCCQGGIFEVGWARIAVSHSVPLGGLILHTQFLKKQTNIVCDIVFQQTYYSHQIYSNNHLQDLFQVFALVCQVCMLFLLIILYGSDVTPDPSLRKVVFIADLRLLQTVQSFILLCPFPKQDFINH